MKKTVLRILSAIMLLVTLLACFASCAEKSVLDELEGNEKAIKFFELISENADGANSYAADISMEMKISGTSNNPILVGGEMLSTAAGKTIYCGINEGEYFEYNETVTSVKVTYKGMEASSTVQTDKNGFVDGKMFESEKTEQKKKEPKERSLCSPISAEDYRAFKEEEIKMFDFDISEEYCSTMTCDQLEDKSWKATYTDFNEKGIEGFNSLLEGLDVLLGNEYKIIDIEIEITATEGLYPSSMTVSPVFEFVGEEEEGSAPVVTVIAEYKDFNIAIPIEVDLSGYNNVYDIRLESYLDQALEEIKNADKGDVKVDVDQTVTYGSQKQTYSEQNYVRFENGEEYTYAINSTINGVGFSIIYADGVQTVKNKDSGQSSVAASDDEAARTFINSLVDPAGFTTKKVWFIKEMEGEDDVYRLSIYDPDLSAIYTMVGSDSAITRRAAYVDITLSDGELTDYKYTLSIEAKVNNATMKIDVVTTCKYR